MSQTRKPIVLAVVIGVVVLLVFGLGVGLGGRGSAGSSGWLDRLGGLGAAADLDLADVTAGPGCAVDAGEVTFTQGCVLQVAARGGGLSVSSPVRRASLTNVGTAVVSLSLDVEDKEISRKVEPGPDGSVDVTFGPDGGQLGLSCLAPLGSSCSVRLQAAG